MPSIKEAALVRQQLLTRYLGPSLVALGAVYMALRHGWMKGVESVGGKWTSGLYATGLFILLTTLLHIGLGQPLRTGRLKTLSICALLSIALLFLAAAKGAWFQGLAVVEPSGVITSWQRDGSSHSVAHHSLLEGQRIGNDEVRNLTAIQAFVHCSGDPHQIAGLIHGSDNVSLRVMLRWFFSYHPPGLVLLFAPFSDNPPFERLMGFLVFLASAAALAWALAPLNREKPYPFLWLAMIYVTMPDMLYRIAFSVSVDTPAMACVFMTVGHLYRAWEEPAGASRDRHILRSGLWMGSACFFKYLVLPLGGICWLFLLPACQKRRAFFILVLFPVLVAGAGMFYGWIASGGRPPMLIAKLHEIAGGPDTGTEPWLSPWNLPRLAITQVGPLLMALALGGLISASTHFKTNPLAWRSLLAWLVFILPWTSIYPLLRHMYPGLPLAIAGCGLPLLFNHPNHHRSLLLAASACAAFGLTKFFLSGL